MVGTQHGTSCSGLFKDILRFPCQYIFSLSNFIIKNQEIFQRNSSIHNINIRNNRHLHRPNAKVYSHQKSIFYAGKKKFNNLPPIVKIQRITRQILKQTEDNTHMPKFFICKDDL